MPFSPWSEASPQGDDGSVAFPCVGVPFVPPGATGTVLPVGWAFLAATRLQQREMLRKEALSSGAALWAAAQITHGFAWLESPNRFVVDDRSCTPFVYLFR